MRVVISTIGRFHCFNLAAEMQARGSLAALFTGYPRFKLRDTPIAPGLIRTFPYIQTPYMALCRFSWFHGRLEKDWAWLAQSAHDRHVARNLPPCDAVLSLSGMGLETGRAARRMGARYVCERGSTHKLTQDAILREEYSRHGFHWPGIDPRNVEKELMEYEEADAISVPSSFALRSFLERGVPAEKMWLSPLGCDLSRFHPLAPKDEAFRVLFVGQVGLRKGLPYLLEAFRMAAIPRAKLVLVGVMQAEAPALLKRYPVPNLEITGVLGGDDLVREMSRASVMVMPSVEDGFGMVLAESLACGTPVITTPNTGAEDLFSDGVEGFIVPTRSPRAIADRLTELARNPEQRAEMSVAARARMRHIRGWHEYGDRMHERFRHLCGLGAP